MALREVDPLSPRLLQRVAGLGVDRVLLSSSFAIFQRSGRRPICASLKVSLFERAPGKEGFSQKAPGPSGSPRIADLCVAPRQRYPPSVSPPRRALISTILELPDSSKNGETRT